MGKQFRNRSFGRFGFRANRILGTGGLIAAIPAFTGLAAGVAQINVEIDYDTPPTFSEGVTLQSTSVRMNGSEVATALPFTPTQVGTYSILYTTDQGTASVDLGTITLGQTYPIDPRGFRGRQIKNYGINADIYANPMGDDLSGDGSLGSPFKTPQAAVTAAQALISGSKLFATVMLIGGLYESQGDGRENFLNANLNGVFVTPYRDQVPVFDGGRELSGWVQCTEADRGFLGPISDIARVWKAPVNTSDISGGSSAALNMREGDVMTFASSYRLDATDLLIDGRNPATFHTANTPGADFIVDGTDEIIAIVDTVNLTAAKLNEANLIGKQVLLRKDPTVIAGDLFIKSTDLANNRIDLHRLSDGAFTDNTNARRQFTIGGGPGAADPDTYQYTIEGLASALQPGTHALDESGGVTTVYYISAKGDGSAPENTRYTAMREAVYVPNPTSAFSIEGVTMQQFASDGASRGNGIYVESGVGGQNDPVISSTGLTVRNCVMRALYNPTATSRGIYARNADGCTFSNNTFFEINGQGIALSGSGGFKITSDNLVYLNFFDAIASDAFSSFFLNDTVFGHNLIDRVGTKAHSSMLKSYAVTKAAKPDVYCRNPCYVANECTTRSNGYLALQRAGALIVIMGNHFPVASANDANARTIVIDNNGEYYPSPEEIGDLVILQNTIPPEIGNTHAGSAISAISAQIDNGDPTTGQGSTDGEGSREAWRIISYLKATIANNVTYSMAPLTNLTNAQELKIGSVVPPVKIASNILHSISNAHGATIQDYDASNEQHPASSVYTAPEQNDFRPLVGGPLFSTKAQSVSRDIARIKAAFPLYDAIGGFDRDYKNRVVDWDIPFVGADSSVQASPTYPIIIDNLVANITANTAEVTVTTDTSGGTIGIAVFDLYESPNESEVVAGTGAIATATIDNPIIGDNTVTITGLPNFEDCKVITWHTNGGETSCFRVGPNFETLPDNGPVVTAAVSRIGGDQAEITITSDVDANLSYMLRTQNIPPNPKLFEWPGNSISDPVPQASLSAGTQSVISVGNIFDSHVYYPFLLVRDTANNTSRVVALPELVIPEPTSELAADPEFDDASKWDVVSGWTVNENGNSALIMSGAAASFSSTTLKTSNRPNLLNGVTYNVSVTIRAVMVSGRFRFFIGNTEVFDEANLPMSLMPQTFDTTYTPSADETPAVYFNKIGNATEMIFESWSIEAQ